MPSNGDLLRIAVETGDWAEVRSRLADDAVLHTSNEDGRQIIEGAQAIEAHLAGPGPGAVRLWDAQEWPTGVALSFEWEGSGGTDRRRWYVRTNAEDDIIELWSTSARPTTGGAAEHVEPPAA